MSGNPQAGVPEGTFPDGPPPGNDPIAESDLISAAMSASTVTVDGQTFQDTSINELIELDKYLKLRRANSNGWGSIGRGRVVPPSGSGRETC